MNSPWTAKGWNEDIAAGVMRGSPIEGRNARLRSVSGGQAIDYLPVPGWLHPWALLPFWNESKELWCARIVPGFVNGQDPSIAIDGSDLPKGARVFGNGYANSKLQTPNSKIEVLLTDEFEPFLVFRGFRDPAAIQTKNGVLVDGAYPEFFKLLGAREPEKVDPLIAAAQAGDGAGAVDIATDELTPTQTVPVPGSEFEFGNRKIVAADVVLEVDRPAVSTSFENVDLFGIPNALVLNTVTITPPPRRYGARLNTTTQFVAVPDPTAQDRLDGTYVEPSFEQILIGTLWLLSPGLDSDGPIPDASWQTFVQGAVFWNLMFGSVDRIDAPVDQNLTLITGLAGGLADPIFAALLAPINEANAKAAAALNQTTMKGFFWTI